MPTTTIDIPAQYAGRRLEIPTWCAAIFPVNYTDPRLAQIIDITGTVLFSADTDTEAQAKQLIDLGIAASTPTPVVYGIRLLPWHDSNITSNDPRVTSGDAASLAYQETVIDARIQWAADKGVAFSFVFLDDSRYSITNAPTDPTELATWLAARNAKYLAYDSLVRSKIPGVHIHMYARGWVRVNLNAAGNLSGTSRSMYGDVTDPGDSISVAFYMPNRLNACQMMVDLSQTEAIQLGGDDPLAVIPWLGTRYDSVGGTLGNYDGDYGDHHAYLLGQYTHGELLPNHVFLYPGPFQNTYWVQHFMAYLMGAFAGEDSIGDQGRLSRSNRILGQTMPTLLTLWVDNDTTILIEGLRESFTGALQNNLTNVTATILDDDGAALSPPIIISMAYVSGSDGNYLATIPDTTALTPDKNYLVVIDANAGDGMVGKWRLRAVARRRNE